MKRSKDSNIIHATHQELLNSGYRPQEVTITKNKVDLAPVGGLLCLTTTKKDLWCELGATDIKSSQVSPEKFLILIK